MFIIAFVRQTFVSSIEIPVSSSGIISLFLSPCSEWFKVSDGANKKRQVFCVSFGTSS